MLSIRLTAGNQPVSKHAAVWVPDKNSDVCMHCHKTTFTVLNRKVTIALHSIALVSLIPLCPFSIIVATVARLYVVRVRRTTI